MGNSAISDAFKSTICHLFTIGIISGVKRVLTTSENVRIGVVSKTLEESELQQNNIDF